jgi:nicotinamide phosphoribosyltransferase
MAHIVNFLGTDTFMSLIGVLAYYTPEYETLLAEAPDNPKRALIRLLKKMKAEKQPLPAFAVIAAEHSTMTIKGREGEKGQIKRLLDEARKRKTIVSIVLDSYDYYHNVGQVLGEEFKQDILEVGKNGGRIILRPDSGDPVDVIVKTLQIVDEKFGCTVNKKGYKVLPPYLRALQGDGIDIDTMLSILRSMKAAGFSAENVLFGMGAGIAQKVNRDDLYFAQKASAACINGVWGDVFKAPKTSAAKVSKKGRVSTVWDGITFTTKRTSELLPGEKDRMVTVFRNGELFNNQTFTQVRQTAEYFTRLYKGTEQPVKEPWEQALLNKNPSPGV